MSGIEEPWVEERGWIAVPNLVTAEEIASILEDCESLFRLPDEQRLGGDKPHSGTRHLMALDRRIPLVAEMVERPALLAPVHCLLGDDIVLTQASLRSPRPGYGQQQLHADEVPKLDDGPDLVTTAIVALVAFDDGNGATRVVDGSHRRPDLQRATGRQAPRLDERLLVGPAGTAFVFSGHLLHAGGHNDSSLDRPVLQVLWRRA